MLASWLAAASSAITGPMCNVFAGQNGFSSLALLAGTVCPGWERRGLALQELNSLARVERDFGAFASAPGHTDAVKLVSSHPVDSQEADSLLTPSEFILQTRGDVFRGYNIMHRIETRPYWVDRTKNGDVARPASAVRASERFR
ncbi:hypothetical protein BP00DRAFT_448574 [Aspergillus indologenus CBS 114.80]|uniref:Uncharacterized protein n=1 Tax=Aspergillus indologenus CBS 114.80 TaxID=1450541 RepID=A0A2V5HZM3_9EURO|nr:hypothetical protein BP00DRAFT_448574 [Aspergillus indologenus CBS 114.80]